jgi:hypothetical protein
MTCSFIARLNESTSDGKSYHLTECHENVPVVSRTPRSTMADRKGSGARLASYRDGVLFATKFAGKVIGNAAISAPLTHGATDRVGTAAGAGLVAAAGAAAVGAGVIPAGAGPGARMSPPNRHGPCRVADGCRRYSGRNSRARAAVWPIGSQCEVIRALRSSRRWRLAVGFRTLVVRS